MSDLSDILDMIDLETFLDDYGIEYKLSHGSSGEQLQIKECPVCGNSSYKVYLNAETGLGNCFAGDHPPDENFNKYTFIKKVLDIDENFIVVKRLKEIAGTMGWRAKRKTPVEVQEKNELVLPISFELPIRGKNLKYLEERRIDIDTAKYFHFRYCDKGEFWYKYNGELRYQDYSKRIIVPIYDVEGKMVSFQGRDITNTSKKKYIFPPGFASTGAVLYNAQNIIGCERVVVGEGVFDVAAIKIAMDEEMSLRGVGQIGTFGKHFSHKSNGDKPDQLTQFILLKRAGLKEVTFMWDSEPAALKAAVSAGLILNKHGLKTRLARLPEGKDPNEVSPDVVREAYWQAKSITPDLAVKIRLGKY